MKDILSNNIIKTITNIINDTTSIQFLQPKLWFSNPGAASFTNLEILSCLGFFVGALIVGVFVLVIDRWRIGNYPPKNRIARPAGWGLFSFGLTGILFTLIRSQGISFLGARIILVGLALSSVVWCIYFLRRYFKDLPAHVVEHEARALKRKYLAKRGK